MAKFSARLASSATSIEVPAGSVQEPTSHSVSSPTQGSLDKVVLIARDAEDSADDHGSDRQEKQVGQVGDSSEPSDIEEVDEQTVRERAYVWSEHEDPEDYTDGPVRMVAASDGLKRCCALLMTFDFSAKVQRALQAERDFLQLKKTSLKQRKISMRLECDLNCEISNHELRISALERKEDPDEAKINSLKEERSYLQRMLKGVEIDEQCNLSLVKSQLDNLQRIQAEANAHLEEAFVCARLLDANEQRPESPIEYLDLKEEYQRFRQAQDDNESGRSIASLDDEYHVQPRQLTPEEEARQNLVDAFWEARELLVEAQSAFDDKERRRALDAQAREAAIERGAAPEDTSQEQFDLRWLERFRGLTRELIEAEEAYSRANTDALEAGIDMNGGDETSVYSGEEVCTSSAECYVSGPQPAVEGWLRDPSDPVSPSFVDKELEVDDWDIRTVDIGSSISALVKGGARKRIDEWGQRRHNF